MMNFRLISGEALYIVVIPLPFFLLQKKYIKLYCMQVNNNSFSYIKKKEREQNVI